MVICRGTIRERAESGKSAVRHSSGATIRKTLVAGAWRRRLQTAVTIFVMKRFLSWNFVHRMHKVPGAVGRRGISPAGGTGKAQTRGKPEAIFKELIYL